MFIDFHLEGRPLTLCLFGAGPVPEAVPSYRSDIAPTTPVPGMHLGSATKWAEMRVCTMCTPWASDRVVLVPDWAGLRRFSGEWRIVGSGTRFESHLGHSVSAVQGPMSL